MELYRFLREESPSFTNKVVILTCAAGVLQGFLVALLINGAGSAAPNNLKFRLFLFYVIGIAAFLWSRRFSLDQTAKAAEEVIERVRLRLAKKIRTSELIDVDLQSGRIYSALTTDTQSISQASTLLANAASAAIMVMAALVFLLTLSQLIFFLTVGFIAFVFYYYVGRRAETNKKLYDAAEMEREYFDGLDDLVNGLKELKQNDRRSREFYIQRLKALSDRALDIRTDIARMLNRGMILSQGLFFALVGAVVFIIPNVSPGDVPNVASGTAMIVFMIGPLVEVITSIQVVAKGTVAIARLKELETFLDSRVHPDSAKTPLKGFSFGAIREVSLDRVRFTYPSFDGSNGGFSVGPLDLTLKRGEIVFIIGGNGSGKSTLMRVLVGLYPPDEGMIRVDGRPISPTLRQNYRNLFSTIFSDFHLFDQLYGLDAPAPDRAADLIEEMGLTEKTRIEGRRITNRNLSTGQRKRLAMIISRIEDRDFFVFDEWAADQDPEFREHFYHVLLPRFREAGKTIVVVSHDDRYFHCADRCLKMEFGQFVPFSPPGP